MSFVPESLRADAKGFGIGRIPRAQAALAGGTGAIP